MKKLLNECLILRRDIESINERIEELNLRIKSPKNQIITDMPKGNNQQNAIEEYLIKKEKLEKMRFDYNRKISGKWQSVYYKCVNNDISKEAIEILRYRFYYGYTWRVCGEMMKWNKNKCFRVYRSVLGKFYK